MLDFIDAGEDDWNIPPRWNGSPHWGGWKLYKDHLAYGDYELDLSRTTGSARVLDMICQIAGKAWATDKCLAGLVRALDDIFHPQAVAAATSTSQASRSTTGFAEPRLCWKTKTRRRFAGSTK